ncbi:MAG TPA: CHAD domain-containing protein [Pseudolabrys sp.]|nr:CHAD domain-containing protein [Pseudolabrys sp.]
MVGGTAKTESGFGDALSAAARSIIADARKALDGREISEAEAVHDVRKALKRWRALLRLLALPLGEQADQMRREARDLMRSLSGARDAQSALDALADLRKSDVEVSPTSLKSVKERLDGLKTAAESEGFREAMRERIRRYLDYATLSVDRWPLSRIEFAVLAEGLTVTYRRARRLLPDEWKSATADELHDLRRRVVEHRHQLELIEPLWPRLGHVWAQEAQRLRNRLGACQDLAVLGTLTGPHQPLAPWRSRLAAAIAARKEAHATAASRMAGRLFAEKPGAFRRRIEALWQAREQ